MPARFSERFSSFKNFSVHGSANETGFLRAWQYLPVRFFMSLQKAIAQGDAAASSGGGCGTHAALQFVGAERLQWRQTSENQSGEYDQSAAASQSIEIAGQQRGEKKEHQYFRCE
jgi:hypothetical protein